MEDLDRAFTFPFRQKEWGLKVLIGSLFVLLCGVGLGIPVIAGYTIRVCQRFMKNDPELLPEWSDVGVLFVTGVKYIVVSLLYQVPVLLLTIPLFFFAALGAALEPSGSATMFFGMSLAGFLLLAIPYEVVYTLLSPVIAYRFASSERISDGLAIATVFRDFRRQWGNVALSAFLIVVVSIFSLLGILLFFFGILATIFYSCLVTAALTGMLARALHAAPGRPQ